MIPVGTVNLLLYYLFFHPLLGDQQIKLKMKSNNIEGMVFTNFEFCMGKILQHGKNLSFVGIMLVALHTSLMLNVLFLKL